MKLLLSFKYSPSPFASAFITSTCSLSPSISSYSSRRSSTAASASASASATSLCVFGQPANINSKRYSQYYSHVRSIRNAAAASDHHFRLPPTSAVSAQVAANSSSKTGLSIKQEMSSKDNDLAFVAGATGRVGSRTVRELLKLGFRVRAGVRSTQRAETLVQSVQQIKVDGLTAVSETQPLEMLEIVECDLENKSTIGPAIGDASVVICCIGASEKEVFDVTGPYRIDYKATENLIQAATVAQVDHFILLTSLGTNKIGFPAAILNLFWGVLIWKRKAEEALIASGLPYTIVRPGGMERPTDSYKETHNTVLANEDTYFGGQVSNLQVAELMAFMAKHKRLSYCKVVEVIAETTAPLTPIEESLAKIPPQRELPPEPIPDPVPDSVSTDTKVPKTKPLSPFTMYDDLKPPTSPSPPKMADPVQAKLEPTTSSAEKEPTTASIQKTSHLSPYIAYDDLKPPTSPIPTPRSSSKGLNDGSTSSSPLLGSDSGNNVGGSSPPTVNEKELPLNSSPRSPFNVYDDMKPPTSPSPSAPSTGSFISTVTGSNNSTPEELGDQKHIKLKTSKPLSPYSMYEDLKPPSSPLPSVPKY